jgi:hypothetical protein
MIVPYVIDREVCWRYAALYSGSPDVEPVEAGRGEPYMELRGYVTLFQEKSDVTREQRRDRRNSPKGFGCEA